MLNRIKAMFFGATLAKRLIKSHRKPSGMKTAYAIELKRNACEIPFIEVDKSI